MHISSVKFIVLKREPSIQYKSITVVYNFGLLAHFAPPGVFLGLGVLAHFGLRNQTRKVVKIHKDFEHNLSYNNIL